MRRYIFGMLFVAIVASASIVVPTPAAAAGPHAACPDSILGITTWYRGLLMTSSCEVRGPNQDAAGKVLTGNADETQRRLIAYIMTIALNVVQALLGIVAYVTVFYIIKGGFNYMTSTGSPDGMQKAKNTIKNAVIGLVVALLSASIVNAIGGAIR